MQHRIAAGVVGSSVAPRPAITHDAGHLLGTFTIVYYSLWYGDMCELIVILMVIFVFAFIHRKIGTYVCIDSFHKRGIINSSLVSSVCLDKINLIPKVAWKILRNIFKWIVENMENSRKWFFAPFRYRHSEMILAFERDALPIFLEPCVLLLTITVILSKKSKKVMI